MLAVSYPVAVLVALNAGGEHRRRICLRVSDEILRLAAFAALPIVVLRDDVWGTPLIPLQPCGPRGSGRLAKRAFDFIVGTALLITPQNPDGEWMVSPDQCTRLGRLLRSTHLDELPQLLNLIRGQMSLIRPRRERPHLTLLES